MQQVIKANKKRCEGQHFKTNELVLLSTENLNLPKGHTRKLCPKYIGPFKILKVFLESLTYKLELSPDLKTRRVHDTFHEKVLKPYIGNNYDKFPKCESHVRYNIGDDLEQEWVIKAMYRGPQMVPSSYIQSALGVGTFHMGASTCHQ